MERVRALVGRLVTTLVLQASLVACERSPRGTDDAPQALRAALAARTVYPAKREEWRSDITTDTDSTMVPQIFRASRTAVALLQSSPARISVFELNRHGMLLSSRPVRIDSVLNADVPRDVVAPTDLTHVTDDGHVDVIDSASSALIRESIGGFLFRREFPLLRGGSGRVCTIAPETLMHVRQLGDLRVLEAFRLTGKPSDDALIGRHRLTGAPASRLRFGTSDARRCLLLAEREVFVVRAPAESSEGATPRVAALKPPGGAATWTIDSGPSRADVANDTTRKQQPFIVDAAVVDGGYAVLVGVVSDRQGRIIDYYDERGQYLQSAMLPFTAAAMTGAGPRFLLLHQDERFRWWLSSWLTPMAARGATPPPAARRIDQAPEKQLFEPPNVRPSRPLR